MISGTAEDLVTHVEILMALKTVVKLGLPNLQLYRTLIFALDINSLSANYYNLVNLIPSKSSSNEALDHIELRG